MSFTEFHYSNASVPKTVPKTGMLSIPVTVSNVGEYDGEEVRSDAPAVTRTAPVRCREDRQQGHTIAGILR